VAYITNIGWSNESLEPYQLLAGAQVFFVLAAWVLPPLDSHQRPVPLVYSSVLTLAILLVLPTVIVVPAYMCRAIN
jgi:hypothetical protein